MKKGLLAFIIMSLLPLSLLAKTELSLAMKLTPTGDFSAKTSEVTGFAYKDGKKVKAQNIIISMTTLDAGLKTRTEHMKNKYLEVGKFPKATLISAEGENGKGKGVLEVHGVKKDVSGDYKIDGAELVAHFPVKISDFNIQKAKYLGVGVNDEVQVEVRVPLKEKATAK